MDAMLATAVVSSGATPRRQLSPSRTYSVQYVYVIMHHFFHVILGLNYVYILDGVGNVEGWAQIAKCAEKAFPAREGRALDGQLN